MRRIILVSILLLTAFISLSAQPYPTSSYQIEDDKLVKWLGTETEIDFTKDPVLRNLRRVLIHAFANNQTLTKVRFHNRMMLLDAQTFYRCSELKEVSFEEGNSPDDMYLEVSDGAFTNCPKLESVSLPVQFRTYADNPETDGIIGYFFENCPSLKNVLFSSNHKFFRTSKGVVYNKDMSRLFYVPSGTTGDYTVSNNVRSLAKYAFNSCNVSNVFLPSEIEIIPENCFEYARNLKVISLPRSLKEIKPHAFGGCKSLSVLILPEGLQRIEDFAFYGCTSLPAKMKLPQSLQYIVGNVFVGCHQIKGFEIPSGGSYTSVDGVLFTSDMTTLVVFPSKEGQYEVPEGTMRLGQNSFNRSLLSGIKLPGSLREIEADALYRCDKLTRIIIPEGVERIGFDAMWGCAVLSYVELPSTLQEIGANCFEEREKGKRAPLKIVCRAVYPPEAKRSIFSEGNNDILYVPEESVPLYKITPNWKNISKILPITDDIFPKKYILSDDKTTLLKWNGEDPVLTFSDYADLNNVRRIASGAFAENNSLECISAENVQAIENSVDGAKGAFENVSKLTEVSFPLLTEVGNRAFAGCQQLKNVNFSYNVSVLGNYSFANCTALEEFPYYSSLTAIGESAFQSCTALRSMMLAPSLSRIGSRALAGCTGLKELTSFAIVPPSLGEQVFSGINLSNVSLSVPAESEAAYKAADQWRDFFNTSGIEKLASDSLLEKTGIYTIGGIRLSNPSASLPKGIYIKGGKKVVVK